MKCLGVCVCVDVLLDMNYHSTSQIFQLLSSVHLLLLYMAGSVYEFSSLTV